ncbi:hypothetical protein [Streptomyces sp. SAI-127]|uniref:hypothetical protein n=1 Tax=Streptomyces sp. SAI-127 TaxID=2940543 RepID=UPI002476D34B|nr:hypothetical protein [Streptomyces sp. SAI-127]MDH6489601.1 hypothetical protein [Streptomyces sp. SAI-127]
MTAPAVEEFPEPAPTTVQELGQALQNAHGGWALDLSPECSTAMAEHLLARFYVFPRLDADEEGLK